MFASDDKKSGNGFLATVKLLFYVLIIILIIRTFFIQAFSIPSDSMEGTLKTGDFIFVNKIIYGPTKFNAIPILNINIPSLPFFKKPKKNDIIVFEYPGDREQLFPVNDNNFVKRLVGSPGDTLQIKDKILFVNGVEFQKPKNELHSRNFSRAVNEIEDKIFPQNFEWNEDNYGPLVVPKQGMTIKLTQQNIRGWKTIIDREFMDRVVTFYNNKIKINGTETDQYTFRKKLLFCNGG